MNQQPPPSAGLMRWAPFVLGILSFVIVLAAYHIADGDLWGKMAIGAHFWKHGQVPTSDYFAFTPVLPRYIEHEWGAGMIFFGVLKFFGPGGLMGLKILLACGAIIAAFATGRRLGVDRNVLFVLAIPVAASLMPGYIPVIRSHAFTYCFFGIILLGLEEIRAGGKWPIFVLPAVMLVWANVHGGFVAGLGAMGVYTVFAFFTRGRWKVLAIVTVASLAVTIINPYGFKFWVYLIPAILHKRPRIAEWQPLPLFANDLFLGFRILFVMVVVLLVATWRRTEKKSWGGLVMLVITTVLAWRSRRHAPFFGVATLAFIGPFLQTALNGIATRLPQRLRESVQPAVAVVAVYGLVMVYVAANFLPTPDKKDGRASFDVLAPVGHDPVREADILMHAHAKGNLASPFGWGCYLSWRLYPGIKVSMDGRYETTYPESTFQLNNDFYDKRGADWDRLIRDYKVDYVILEFTQERLRPQDLIDHGYVLIWVTENNSALMALKEHEEELRKVVAELPPTTINPLDASIPDKWWTTTPR